MSGAETGRDIIVQTQVAPYRLRLCRAWNTSKGSRDVRSGWIVRIRSAQGLTGFGDCAPLPEVGTEHPSLAAPALVQLGRGCIGESPETALRELAAWDTPAARCAIETALLDLLSKRAGLPLAKWLNPGAPSGVAVNAVLGDLDETTPVRAREAVRRGFSVLKVKLGVHQHDYELAALQRLASALDDGPSLRLDANGAWDESRAYEAIVELRGYPVECLEEPLATLNRDVLARLQEQVPWPLALDESLSKRDTEALLGSPPVRRLVVKPMTVGGLLPSMQLVGRAYAAGLDCVVTTTVDSAVGVWATLHLAAAVDTGVAHGLSTSTWIQEDVGPAPSAQSGRLSYGGVGGLGFTPSAVLEFAD